MAAEPLSLSIPDLIRSVQRFLPQEKHALLEGMLDRYLRKELGKAQVRARPCARVAGACARACAG